MSEKFFVSDLHFDHRNIIAYDQRPWDSIESMNAALIKNINITCKENDSLYILGDVFLHNKTKRWLEILDQIKCKNLYLIRGNHDTPKQEVKERFLWVKDYYRLKFQTDEKEMENLPEKLKDMIRLNKYKIRFIMFHFPILSWHDMEHGTFHLHGHTHTNGHTDFYHQQKVNVGCMHNGFKPFSVKDIFDTIGERE